MADARNVAGRSTRINPTYIAACQAQLDVAFDSCKVDDFYRATSHAYINTYTKPSAGPHKTLNFCLMGKRFNIFNLIFPRAASVITTLHHHCDSYHYMAAFAACHKPHTQDLYSFQTRFILKFNTAYLTFLEAINGCPKALNNMKNLFSFGSAEFIQSLNVNPAYLTDTAKDNLLPQALLAYLMLNVVFAINENISYKARYRAMQIIKANFNIEKLAEGLQKFPGYELLSDVPMLLLPPAFKPDTQVFKSHYESLVKNREIFFGDATIQSLLHPLPVETESWSTRVIQWQPIDCGKTAAKLIAEQPSHYLQIVNSLLLLSHDPDIQVSNSDTTVFPQMIYKLNHNVSDLFLLLFAPMQLDKCQREAIYGFHASYHSLHQYIGHRGLENVALGRHLNASATDAQLLQLSPEELVQRIRQLQNGSREPELISLAAANGIVINELRILVASKDEKIRSQEVSLHETTANYKYVSEQLRLERNQTVSLQAQLRLERACKRELEAQLLQGRKHEATELETHCSNLGINAAMFAVLLREKLPTKAEDTVKLYYTTGIKWMHPDKNSNSALSNEVIKKMNEARDYLNNEIRRVFPSQQSYSPSM